MSSRLPILAVEIRRAHADVGERPLSMTGRSSDKNSQMTATSPEQPSVSIAVFGTLGGNGLSLRLRW